MTKSEIHELIEDAINDNEGWDEQYGEYDIDYLSDKNCQYVVDELERIRDACVDEPEEEFVKRRVAFIERLLKGWIL